MLCWRKPSCHVSFPYYSRLTQTRIPNAVVCVAHCFNFARLLGSRVKGTRDRLNFGNDKRASVQPLITTVYLHRWPASASSLSVIVDICIALSVLPFQPCAGSPPKPNACVPLLTQLAVPTPYSILPALAYTRSTLS